MTLGLKSKVTEKSETEEKKEITAIHISNQDKKFKLVHSQLLHYFPLLKSLSSP